MTGVGIYDGNYRDQPAAFRSQWHDTLGGIVRSRRRRLRNTRYPYSPMGVFHTDAPNGIASSHRACGLLPWPRSRTGLQYPPVGREALHVASGTRTRLWGDAFNLYSKGRRLSVRALNANMIWQLSPDLTSLRRLVNSNYCKYGWSSLHGGEGFSSCSATARSRPCQEHRLNILAALATMNGGEVIPNY